MIISQGIVQASARSSTPIVAKNLPNTISHTLTGAVSSSLSVPCLYSSLNSRMVKIGMRNRKTMSMLEKTLPTSLEEDNTQVAKK